MDLACHRYERFIGSAGAMTGEIVSLARKQPDSARVGGCANWRCEPGRNHIACGPDTARQASRHRAAADVADANDQD
ncbi:hypothetical protein ASL20_16100 [Cupriavidus necator]|nr:hypothetical protein ASL20_16100 [Cupriavidus necator]